jgi:hypothetical protein
MIPYDDLVVALAAWRAKQGLPVAQLAGAPPPPPPPARAPAPPPPAARTAPPRARTAPPAAPAPARTTATAMPVPPVANEVQDFDEAEGGLVEEGHYDAGDDFAVPFGSAAFDPSNEATAIGGAPSAPTDAKRGKRNPDW